MSFDWDKRQTTLGKHKHLAEDILDFDTGEQAALGSAVTVDNQSDPPAEVTTIVAPGATIVGDEATLSLPIFQTTTVLTDADIKSLKTAKVIVADPGAGKFIDFISITLAEKTPNAAAYATLAPTSALLIELGQMQVGYIRNDAAFDSGMLTDLFSDDGGTIIVRPGIDIGANGSGTGQPLGTYAPGDILGALSLRLDQTNNLTGGHADNTLTVVTIYAVIDLP